MEVKKTVIEFYYYWNYREPLERAAAELQRRGVVVDLVCLADFATTKHSQVKWHWQTRLFLKLFARLGKTNIVSRVCRRLYTPLMMKRLVAQYDKVSIQAYVEPMDRIVDECVAQGKPFDIQMWGSDIIRPTESHLQVMRKGFEHCEYIRGVPNMLQLISQKLGPQYEAKYRPLCFGIEMLDVIDRTDAEWARQTAQHIIGDAKGKKVVAVGYNGRDLQWHDKVLDVLTTLPADIKDKVYLLFPMTYSHPSDYIEKVKRMAAESGMEYRFLFDYLSPEELAAVRLGSDMMLMFQATDAFSGSVQEHLYCKNVVFIADWISYPLMDATAYFYVKSNFEQLRAQFIDVVEHFEQYHARCADNPKCVRSVTGWENAIERWYQCYAE